MARLWSSGFELDALLYGQSGIEWTVLSSGQTIVTSPVHGGMYSCKIDGTQNTQEISHQFLATPGNGPIYVRVYLYISTYPNVQNAIIEIDNSSNNVCAGIALGNTGSLQLFDNNGYFGSSSAGLNLNQWYRIELKVDKTGGANNYIVEGKINGSVFSTANNRNFTPEISTLFLGAAMELESLTSGTWYFDDVAINDATGTYQTGYPGDGTIMRLTPNASGDSNTFATQVGGTAGSANNYTRVDEVTPDDATSYNASVTIGASDLFKNTSATGLTGGSVVNAMHIGGRIANITAADATTALKLQVEKTSGGTVATSSPIIPNSTTWSTTSAGVNPYTYPITLYQDPNGLSWTLSTLNSLQVGYTISAVGTNPIGVSTVWVLVDYTTYTSSPGFFEFL